MLEITQDKPYVYTLARPNGVVFYIGKGTNGRINAHEWEVQYGKLYNAHKSNVIRKILREGDKIQKTILNYFDTDEEAHAYEVALIFFMRPYDNLTNITDGGEGILGMTRSEETRQKISEAKQNISEETRRKLSESRNGRTHTEEVRHKMSIKAQERGPVSEGTRRKLSESHKGKKRSEETRRRISEAKKNQSEETRRKISETKKGKPRSEETKRKVSEAKQGQTPWNKGISMTDEQKRKQAEVRIRARMQG